MMASVSGDTAALGPADLDANPVAQFRKWFDEALEAGQPEPEAMALATTGDDGPSVRFVLLKAFDHRGFVFYTNYHSRKGAELGGRPRAALAWRWALLDRQVRVSGLVERVSAEESDAYFASRPRGSAIGAWASEQSTVIPDRSVLEARVTELEARFGTEAQPPRPPWWGGFRVLPRRFEFWQARTNRLHDRFQYRPGDTGWVIERLSP